MKPMSAEELRNLAIEIVAEATRNRDLPYHLKVLGTKKDGRLLCETIRLHGTQDGEIDEATAIAFDIPGDEIYIDSDTDENLLEVARIAAERLREHPEEEVIIGFKIRKTLAKEAYLLTLLNNASLMFVGKVPVRGSTHFRGDIKGKALFISIRKYVHGYTIQPGDAEIYRIRDNSELKSIVVSAIIGDCEGGVM